MIFKKHIPNFLTLLNLLAGCVGIIFALEGNQFLAAVFIWTAAIMDFLDGFAARLLKVHSAIGKELDSLADVVSFGVLPSCILFQMLRGASGSEILPYAAFLVALFSALRLARFNVDDRQSDSFIGLPVPANAIMISSYPLIAEETGFFLFDNAAFLIFLTVLSSYLLVSGIPLFAFKFKGFGWKENRPKYIFLLLSLCLIALFRIPAIPAIILLYILFSVILNSFSNQVR